MSFSGTLPDQSTGLQLHRVKGDDLIACEPIQFDLGFAAVDTVLRRASLSGRVEIGGELAEYFADIHDAEGDLLETAGLDHASYRALKYQWMRCKQQSS